MESRQLRRDYANLLKSLDSTMQGMIISCLDREQTDSGKKWARRFCFCELGPVHTPWGRWGGEGPATSSSLRGLCILLIPGMGRVCIFKLFCCSCHSVVPT